MTQLRIHVFLSCLLTVVTNAAKNNVCTDFISYNFKSLSKNCYHHPDGDVTDAVTLMRHHVPEVESHYVTTEDGYILTLLRMPQKDPKAVVWVQHAVTVDGISWIMQGNNSLGFLLWKAGYDVWIPSNRGTTLSPGHLTLSQKDFEYWDYSFHEIGYYDYKALGDFIYEKTNGTQSFFIGFSMGSTASLIYASLQPEASQRSVKMFINMATAVYYEHMPMYLRYLAYYEKIAKPILNFLKVGGLMQYDAWYMILGRKIIIYYPLNRLLNTILLIACGWTPNELDPQIFGLQIPKLTRGFSTKTLFHYLQLAMTKSRFQQFDYGKKKNSEIYESEKPPEYPLDKIKTPFHFIYSDSDFLATQKDNEAVFSSLPVEAQHGTYVLSKVNHVEYLFGKHIKEKIYDHVLEFIDRNK